MAEDEVKKTGGQVDGTLLMLGVLLVAAYIINSYSMDCQNQNLSYMVGFL